MPDPLECLWPHFDDSSPLFSNDVVRAWQNDAFERLCKFGLLQEAASAALVPCPSCPDGHMEEVMRLEGDDGASARYFISCPKHLRVAISESARRQWTINFDRLIAHVSTAVAAKGTISVVVPGRLWRLGKVSWQSATRESLVARGLQLSNAPEIVKRIGQFNRAIMFIARRLPPEEIWGDRRPSIVQLSHVVTLGQARIDIDHLALASAIADADEDAKKAESQTLTRERLETIVRRQVKAERKSELTDDAILQAYRDHGSYRKAARALTDEGYQVDHSKVGRVVKRAGSAAVAREDSSDSVRRTVASQRRDGRKKIRQSTEAIDFERDSGE